MNLENVKRAIAVMERVKYYPAHQFNMSYWFWDRKHQNPPEGFTEKAAVSCGTSACFLGWLALAEDIPEILINDDGVPMGQRTFHGALVPGAFSLSEFLEIPFDDAYGLCGLAHLDQEGQPSRYYVPKDGVPQDVINKLKLLIEDNSQS